VGSSQSVAIPDLQFTAVAPLRPRPDRTLRPAHANDVHANRIASPPRTRVLSVPRLHLGWSASRATRKTYAEEQCALDWLVTQEKHFPSLKRGGARWMIWMISVVPRRLSCCSILGQLSVDTHQSLLFPRARSGAPPRPSRNRGALIERTVASLRGQALRCEPRHLYPGSIRVPLPGAAHTRWSNT
jgi:hypothetical protein